MTAPRRVLLASMFVLGSLLASCKSSSSSSFSSGEPEGTPSDPVKVCTKEGQNCVFTEGKLGLCTQKMERGGGAEPPGGASGNDAGAPHFTCMSLH